MPTGKHRNSMRRPQGGCCPEAHSLSPPRSAGPTAPHAPQRTFARTAVRAYFAVAVSLVRNSTPANEAGLWKIRQWLDTMPMAARMRNATMRCQTVVSSVTFILLSLQRGVEAVAEASVWTRLHPSCRGSKIDSVSAHRTWSGSGTTEIRPDHHRPGYQQLPGAGTPHRQTFRSVKKKFLGCPSIA